MPSSDYVEHVIREADDQPADSYEELCGRMAELLKGYVDLAVYLQDCGMTQFSNVDERMDSLESCAGSDLKAWRDLIRQAEGVGL